MLDLPVCYVRILFEPAYDLGADLTLVCAACKEVLNLICQLCGIFRNRLSRICRSVYAPDLEFVLV